MIDYLKKKEVNHMKKIFTFVLAALIALTFSAVGFAQENAPAAGGTDQGAAAPAPEKKAPAKKKAKKAKKAPKKTEKKEEAPAAPAEPAPAPAK